jgi:hypothetical protein
VYLLQLGAALPNQMPNELPGELDGSAVLSGSLVEIALLVCLQRARAAAAESLVDVRVMLSGCAVESSQIRVSTGDRCLAIPATGDG